MNKKGLPKKNLGSIGAFLHPLWISKNIFFFQELLLWLLLTTSSILNLLTLTQNMTQDLTLMWTISGINFVKNHGTLKNKKKIKNFDFSVIFWHIRSTPNIIKLLTDFLACFIEYHKKVQYLWFNFRGCNCSLNIVVAIFWALLTTLGVLLGY